MQLSAEEISMVVQALEHYAVHASNPRYQDLARSIAAEQGRTAEEKPIGEEPEKEAPWR